MYGKMKEFLTKELAGIKEAGLYKNERPKRLISK